MIFVIVAVVVGLVLVLIVGILVRRGKGREPGTGICDATTLHANTKSPTGDLCLGQVCPSVQPTSDAVRRTGDPRAEVVFSVEELDAMLVEE